MGSAREWLPTTGKLLLNNAVFFEPLTSVHIGWAFENVERD
jgi:hypothetical protein